MCDVWPLTLTQVRGNVEECGKSQVKLVRKEKQANHNRKKSGYRPPGKGWVCAP